MPTIDDIAYIYNALPTASIILKANAPHFSIVTANIAFLNATHTDLALIKGKDFFDKFPETIKDNALDSMLMAFEEVLLLKHAYQIKNYKYTHTISDQEQPAGVFWKIEVYPLLDLKGEIEYIVQSWEDVTESKLAQDALKSSNELYDYVNKATNDAIYDWNIINDHLEWGEAFSRVFGYQHNSKFTIDNWSEILHPDDLEYTNKSLSNLLNDKTRINWAIEYRLRKANGEYAFVQENGYVLRDNDGNAIRMIGVLKDITERMEHELKIQEHLERYNAVSKATSDTIWDYNLLTNEIVWNNDGKDIFGHRRANDTYDWWKEHVHPDDLPKILALFDTCISQQRPRWIGEYRFRCPDGSYKAVLDRGFLIFDTDGKVIRMIGAMQDITERVNYIHTIEQRNLKLSDIAWAQAHLVRAPLARIIGIVQLLKDDDEKTADNDERKLLSYLDISAKELDEIVTGIIDKSII
jgi:PAS domain S-box-containing protein